MGAFFLIIVLLALGAILVFAIVVYGTSDRTR
jgi:hypothetical protein